MIPIHNYLSDPLPADPSTSNLRTHSRDWLDNSSALLYVSLQELSLNMKELMTMVSQIYLRGTVSYVNNTLAYWKFSLWTYVLQLKTRGRAPVEHIAYYRQGPLPILLSIVSHRLSHMLARVARETMMPEPLDFCTLLKYLEKLLWEQYEGRGRDNRQGWAVCSLKRRIILCKHRY